MARRGRGVTLIEVLFTLFIVSLVLGAAAFLVHQYAEVLGWEAGKTATMTGVQLGLDRMAGEVQEEVTLSAPPSGASSNQLAFTKIDNTLSGRLPSPLSVPLPIPPWNPQDPGYLATVSYSVSTQNLIRTVTNADGSVVTQTVAGSVTSLTCTRVSSNSLQIVLNVQEVQQMRTLTAAVFLHDQTITP